MSQEQRDSYVIPPNFIEGGSFFGGLFKARNVVEAVILAAGTGLPILTLSLTLTVRIILLCLTSLPLALLALIGIAGMPLSSYIILFFRFLRNRRTLSKSGGKSSRKQAILPTWDKKSGPSTAVQPAAYKKDGSRIRFAKDTRRLMTPLTGKRSRPSAPAIRLQRMCRFKKLKTASSTRPTTDLSRSWRSCRSTSYSVAQESSGTSCIRLSAISKSRP